MQKIEKYSIFELAMHAKTDGNPFTDATLEATFKIGEESLVVTGFYDGQDTFRVRHMPLREGIWYYETKSNIPELNGRNGEFQCVKAPEGKHGPVRVSNIFHFAYDDGTPYYPVGTTAYNWTNQSTEIVEKTLDTLSRKKFNKIRFSPFPKHYLYNFNEPVLYPFEGGIVDPSKIPDIKMNTILGGADSSAYQFDFTKLNPVFFQDFETRVDQLGELGIEADIILFHPYDRWGFSRMPEEANQLYLKYMMARLSSFSNVWWSMANEWDLLRHRSVEDWEGWASTVLQNDPMSHLCSIHNCMTEYDHTKPWITHVSWQRIDLFTHVDQTPAYRDRYQKPFVIDEIAYEGDIDQGWGNITGEELTRRFWETSVRGGYCTHGETFLREDEVLWWAKGGELTGCSPERIGFLLDFLKDFGQVTPIQNRMTWDICWGASGELTSTEVETPFGNMMSTIAERMFCYFGFMRPKFRQFVFPEDQQYEVTIVDTWEMTAIKLEGLYSGVFKIDLPAKTGIAVKFVRC